MPTTSAATLDATPSRLDATSVLPVESRYGGFTRSCGVSLARRSRPGSLQASSDSSPVSERPRTTVSVLEHCIPVSSADTRRHLRSANRHLLAVPRFQLNTYGRRAFSVAGLIAWNSLRDFIRDPTSSTDCFRRLLKRTCSRVTSASSALGVHSDYALYKSTNSLSLLDAGEAKGGRCCRFGRS